jgi:hypothetical protein
MGFDRVTFRASNGSSMTRAVSIGGGCSGTVFRHVAAIATGGATTLGISFESPGATPRLESVTIVAGGGRDYNQGLYLPSGGTVTDTSLRVEGPGIEGVILAGGVSRLSGVQVDCVTASGSWGQVLRLSASGGSPQATIENSSFVLSGSGGGVGLTTYLDGGTVFVRRTTVDAGTGTGIYTNGGAGVFNVESSTVIGATATLNLAAGTSARVAASQLSGGPALGAVSCVGVYDESYSSSAYAGCP